MRTSLDSRAFPHRLQTSPRVAVHGARSEPFDPELALLRAAPAPRPSRVTPADEIMAIAARKAADLPARLREARDLGIESLEVGRVPTQPLDENERTQQRILDCVAHKMAGLCRIEWRTTEPTIDGREQRALWASFAR